MPTKGSTASPRCRTVKCRCGNSLLPDNPISPMRFAGHDALPRADGDAPLAQVAVLRLPAVTMIDHDGIARVLAVQRRPLVDADVGLAVAGAEHRSRRGRERRQSPFACRPSCASGCRSRHARSSSAARSDSRGGPDRGHDRPASGSGRIGRRCIRPESQAPEPSSAGGACNAAIASEKERRKACIMVGLSMRSTGSWRDLDRSMKLRRRPPPGGVAADTASQRELTELEDLPSVGARNCHRVVGRTLTLLTPNLCRPARLKQASSG